MVLPSDSLSTLLNTTATPSLRAVAFAFLSTEPNPDALIELLPSLSRLDMLQSDEVGISSLQPGLDELPVPCLATFSCLSLSLGISPHTDRIREFDMQSAVRRLGEANAPHHRMFFHQRDKLYAGQRLLEAAQELVLVPGRASLSLPASLRHDETYLASSVKDVVEAARVAQVEILWFDEDEGQEYAVSPSFWRYAKKLKARRTAHEQQKQKDGNSFQSSTS
ncbi:hypothetical protein JCM8547_008118 [Rhodosporidiobolus lusitaniae]